jgi:hypothetical protein
MIALRCAVLLLVVCCGQLVAGEYIRAAPVFTSKTPTYSSRANCVVIGSNSIEHFTQQSHTPFAVEAVASATAHLAAVTWLQNPACGWAKALQTCRAFYPHHLLHDMMHMFMGIVISTCCCCCCC